jgi:hypothetical protein
MNGVFMKQASAAAYISKMTLHAPLHTYAPRPRTMRFCASKDMSTSSLLEMSWLGEALRVVSSRTGYSGWNTAAYASRYVWRSLLEARRRAATEV